MSATLPSNCLVIIRYPLLPYIASLPVTTSHLRNSQWRTSCMRSLPPLWYQPLSQSSAAISSAVKLYRTSSSISEAPASAYVAFVGCSEVWICVFIVRPFFWNVPLQTVGSERSGGLRTPPGLSSGSRFERKVSGSFPSRTISAFSAVSPPFESCEIDKKDQQ